MPLRRKEEDTPSRDYLTKLRALGPRSGESNLAYSQRLQSTQASRMAWVDLWRKHQGNGSACCREAGIDRSNLGKTLKNIGLSRQVLDELSGLTTIQVPAPIPVEVLDPRSSIHFPRPPVAPKRKG